MASNQAKATTPTSWPARRRRRLKGGLLSFEGRTVRIGRPPLDLEFQPALPVSREHRHLRTDLGGETEAMNYRRSVRRSSATWWPAEPPRPLQASSPRPHRVARPDGSREDRPDAQGQRRLPSGDRHGGRSRDPNPRALPVLRRVGHRRFDSRSTGSICERLLWICDPKDDRRRSYARPLAEHAQCLTAHDARRHRIRIKKTSSSVTSRPERYRRFLDKSARGQAGQLPGSEHSRTG